MVIRGVVFDVDDTLYLERDYVRSGFEHVARTVAESDAEEAELFGWLWTAFVGGLRGDTFDRLLAAHPQLLPRFGVPDLVRAYRSHQPTIELIPGARDVLDTLLARSIRLGILSDGPLESQTAKVASLGLERWCDPILLTASKAPRFTKPGTAGFLEIEATWNLPSAEIAYVADNPEKDFIAPRALGWRAIRVREARQLRHALEPDRPAAAPDVEIESLGELTAIVL